MAWSFPLRATGSPEGTGEPWLSPVAGALHFHPTLCLDVAALSSPTYCVTRDPSHWFPQSGTEKPRIDTGVRGFFLWNGPLGFRVNLRTQDALRRWQNSARYSHAGHLSDVTSCGDGGKIRALILNTETVNRIPLRRKYAHGQD